MIAQLLQIHMPMIPMLCAILAAPIAAMCRGGMFAWLASVSMAWIALWASLHLVMWTANGTILSYAVGGWAPPFGIEYRVDRLSAVMLLLLSLMASVVLPFARQTVEREIAPNKIPSFYAAFMLCLAGLMGMAATNDAFNFYVFIEISSLAMYALIAMGRDRRALSSAFQYLLLGTVGASFILAGIGFLYALTGTLNISDLAHLLPQLEQGRAILAAYALIAVGLTMKMALFPLHMWLPNAYAFAPSMVTVFLSATATKIAVYALLRFSFHVFDPQLTIEALPTETILLILAVPAMLVGSLVACYQHNIKRLLAYSSIAQIGYILLAVGLGTQEGLAVSVLHMMNHALIKASLFMAVACFAFRLMDGKDGEIKLYHLCGAGRLMPWTSFAFVLGWLGLVGVPLTAGFVSKWQLLHAVWEQPFAAILVVIILFSSLLAVIYGWRVVEALYFGKESKASVKREAPLGMLLPTWLMIVLMLLAGIFPATTTQWAQDSARLLMRDPMMNRQVFVLGQENNLRPFHLYAPVVNVVPEAGQDKVAEREHMFLDALPDILPQGDDVTKGDAQ